MSRRDSPPRSPQASGGVEVHVVPTPQLSAADRAAIRALLNAAFAGDFTDDDWQHALGGWHAIGRRDDSPIAHAAVVERPILVGSRMFRAGYVEAVGVAPPCQGRGLGTAVMQSITAIVRRRFELGALSTGEWHFYQRLGWERWRGPTYVRSADGRIRRSEEEDDAVMVLRCAASAGIDSTAPIVCDERAGDSW